jgi:hypothetical protein
MLRRPAIARRREKRAAGTAVQGAGRPELPCLSAERKSQLCNVLRRASSGTNVAFTTFGKLEESAWARR